MLQLTKKFWKLLIRSESLKKYIKKLPSQTIPTEPTPLVGDVSANFYWQKIQ
jgi:hypothetical protein